MFLLPISVDTQVQASAGGGNVFNSAPLFGNQNNTKGGNSSGSNSAGNTAAASPGGGSSTSGATALDTLGTGTIGLPSISQYLPYILMASGLLIVISILKAAFSSPKKRSR